MEEKALREMQDRFLAIREALGKTQAEMSAALGYSDSYYSKLEVGKDEIRKNVILQTCLTFHVNYDYLMYGEGPMFAVADVRMDRMCKLFQELPELCQEYLIDMIEFMVNRHQAAKAPVERSEENADVD